MALFVVEGCRASSNTDKTQPRVSSAELHSSAEAKKQLGKEVWQERGER